MISLTIQRKLFLVFLLIVLLGGAMGLVNLFSARHLAADIRAMGHNLDRARAIMVLHDQVQAVMAMEMRLLSRELAPGERQDLYQGLTSGFGRLEQALRTYELMARELQEQQELAALWEQWQAWRQAGEAYLALCRSLDKADILDPPGFQNALFLKKEDAYQWVLALGEAVGSQTVFTGALSREESELARWLFELTSVNSSLAVAIGKARRPLDRLYLSARRINDVIRSGQPGGGVRLRVVYENETLPAKAELFAALDLMVKEADKASAIYLMLGQQEEELSRQFVVINRGIERLMAGNGKQAAIVMARSEQEVSRSSRISGLSLLIGLGLVLLFAMVMGRYIARPLVLLRRGMEDFVANSDFSTRIKVAGRDEVAMAGRAFNDMVAQLQVSYGRFEVEKNALSTTGEQLNLKNKALARANDELISSNAELVRDNEHQLRANQELALNNETLAVRCRALEADIRAQAMELEQRQQHIDELGRLLAARSEGLEQQRQGYSRVLAELEQVGAVSTTAENLRADSLARVAHQISSQVKVLVSLAGLALKQEAPVKVIEYLDTMKKTGQRLLVAIAALLKLGRAGHADLGIEEVPFNLTDILDNIRSLMGRRAQAGKVDFAVRCADDVPVQLIGDPHRLTEVLTQLIDNALRFTDGGQVLVDVAMQRKRGRAVELLFTVSDSGPGIAEQDRHCIFEPFGRAEGADGRHPDGVGLGLAISRVIVEACGGGLWLESAVGRGSVFSFTCQLKRPLHVELPHRYKELFNGKRVLLVDDNTMFRHFMARMFTSFHFEVASAESGEVALQRLTEMALQQSLPDLIVLDQLMPGVDGLGLVKVLGQDTALASLPVIMISVDGQNAELRHQAAALGVQAVLSKPVKRELLLSCLERVLTVGTSGPAKKALVANPASLARCRILLVEENAVNRQVVADVLRRAGARVLVAPDGEEPLVAVGQGFDAVVMAAGSVRFNMPDSVRAMGWQGVPVIAMTAGARGGEVEKDHETGVVYAVAKPIDPEQLCRTVAAAIAASQGEEGSLSQQAAGTTHGDEGLTMAGVDVDRALRRLNHNRVLFHKLLGEFLLENENSVDEIHTCFQAGELGKAIHLVHTLKGVAGNLGAADLQEAAKAVEDALVEEGTLPPPLLTGLALCLDQVLTGIGQWVAMEGQLGDRPDSIPPAQLPVGEDLKGILVSLYGHIKANTPRAAAFIQDLPIFDDKCFEGGRREIMAHLERFDFEGAGRSLMRLATELGVPLR